MKIKLIKPVKYALGFLGLSAITALASDLIYGKKALAEEYVVGDLLGHISSTSLSFVVIMTLILLFVHLFLKKIDFESLSRCHCEPIESQEEEDGKDE